MTRPVTQAPVLLYHKIDLPSSDVRIRGAFVAPRTFAAQLAYLKKRGFRFHTVSDLIRHYLSCRRFPPDAVALSFDDGWKDNYVHAFPLLKAFGATATIFLVPACIGHYTDAVTADGEGRREHLSEADIREMSAYGIEFGSHGMTHRLFDRLTADEIVDEVVTSKTFIENLVQKECRVLAYPAGRFTGPAKAAVRQAGYDAAFSTTYGPADPLDLFALNRVEILRRDRFPFQFGWKIRSLRVPRAGRTG